jgi:hypothetical protein
MPAKSFESERDEAHGNLERYNDEIRNVYVT